MTFGEVWAPRRFVHGCDPPSPEPGSTTAQAIKVRAKSNRNNTGICQRDQNNTIQEHTTVKYHTYIHQNNVTQFHTSQCVFLRNLCAVYLCPNVWLKCVCLPKLIRLPKCQKWMIKFYLKNDYKLNPNLSCYCIGVVAAPTPVLIQRHEHHHSPCTPTGYLYPLG